MRSACSPKPGRRRPEPFVSRACASISTILDCSATARALLESGLLIEPQRRSRVTIGHATGRGDLSWLLSQVSAS